MGERMKITEHRGGAWTVFERLPYGWYSVKLYRPAGQLEDKITTDTRAGALEYLRAFNKIAKGMK